MNTMDKIHNGLLRKYHTLCSQLGLSEDAKQAIKESYKVESSADFDTHDLIDICASLSKQLEGGKSNELSKQRKRVIAAIGGYLRAAGHENNIDIIKAIACRATGIQNFNQIPLERLRNLYAAFTKKAKDFASVDSICTALLAEPAGKGNNVILN